MNRFTHSIQRNALNPSKMASGFSGRPVGTPEKQGESHIGYLPPLVVVRKYNSILKDYAIYQKLKVLEIVQRLSAGMRTTAKEPSGFLNSGISPVSPR